MIKTFFKDIETHSNKTSKYGEMVYSSEIGKNWVVDFNVKKAEEAIISIFHVFKSLDVEFFVVYGTALGVYREKGFLEHDCDIDLGVFLKDKDIFIEAIQVLVEEYKFEVYKINILEESLAIVRDNIAVEFGLFSKKGEYYNYDNEKVYNIPSKHLDNLDCINFLGLDFLILYDIEGYLEYQYGKDWNIVITDFYNPYKRYIERPISRKLSFIMPNTYAHKIASFVARVIQQSYYVIRRR